MLGMKEAPALCQLTGQGDKLLWDGGPITDMTAKGGQLDDLKAAA